MTLQQQLAALTHNIRLNEWEAYFRDLKNVLADFPSVPDEVLHSLGMAERDFGTYQDDLKMELEDELNDQWETEKEEIKDEMREEFAEALESMAEDYK